MQIISVFVYARGHIFVNELKTIASRDFVEDKAAHNISKRTVLLPVRIRPTVHFTENLTRPFSNYSFRQNKDSRIG